MKRVDLRKHPLGLLLAGLALSLLVLGLLVLRVKKVETRLLSEWARMRYLAYLLQTKAPPERRPLSAEDLKRELSARGLETESLRRGPLGVEITLEADWKTLARLLSFLGEKDLRVRSLKAEDPSGEGRFRVRMVVE